MFRRRTLLTGCFCCAATVGGAARRFGAAGGNAGKSSSTVGDGAGDADADLDGCAYVLAGFGLTGVGTDA